MISNLIHWYLLWFTLFLGLALPAMASKNPLDYAFGPGLDNEIRRFSEITSRSSTSGDLNASPDCKKRYARLFDKKILKITLGFGYADTSPGNAVLDFYSYYSLVTRLIRPCGPDMALCGFTRDRKDPDMLRKIAFAPTDENNYLIELRIIRPSLSPSNEHNLSSENRQRQIQACEKATESFFSDVAKGTDVIIYTGHSRDGGGPDFCPAILNKESHVNYAYYQSKKPGLTRMLDAMKTAKAAGTPNKVIALFSCSSQKHFLKKFIEVNKSAGYILTKRVSTFHEVNMDTYTALDGILAQRCSEGFELSFGERGAANWKNMFEREI